MQSATLSRPRFLEPEPEPVYQTILKSMHSKQEQISKILKKYQEGLPHDDLRIGLPATSTHHPSASLHRGSGKSKSKRQSNVGEYSQRLGKQKNRRSRTIQVMPPPKIELITEKQPLTAEEYAKWLQKKFQPYIAAQAKKGKNKFTSKLPSVARPKPQKEREQYEIEYEIVDKNYNDKMTDLYQGFSLDSQDLHSVSLQADLNTKVKGRKRKSVGSREADISLDRMSTILKKAQPHRFKNILDPEEGTQEQAADIPKPLPYTPYRQVEEPEGVKTSRQLPQSTIQKSGEVRMQYYIESLNEKWREQCKEELNFLYFSRADDTDRDREWAEKILDMFHRHDQELGRMHHDMRYLDHFDQAFFTAGLYQEQDKKQ